MQSLVSHFTFAAVCIFWLKIWNIKIIELIAHKSSFGITIILPSFQSLQMFCNSLSFLKSRLKSYFSDHFMQKLRKAHLKCKTAGSACCYSVRGIGKGVLLAQFLVAVPIQALPATVTTPMSAVDLLLFVYNSCVGFQHFARTELWVAFVAEVGKGVKLCVTF